MKIHVNGKLQELQNVQSVQDLIKQLGLHDKRLAVEVNLEIVPRSQYAEYRLKEADRIEIVNAIGGG